MRPFKLAVALVLAAATLVGCGSSSPTRPKTSRSGMKTMSALQPGLPMPGVGQMAAPGADQGRGAQLLERVRQEFAKVSGFDAEILARTQGHYKQGKKVDELRKVSIGYKVVWMKPSKFRAEVYNSPDPLMEGAGLVTTDGVNITARAKGLLSFIPIKARANDPKLGNARNHTFDKYGPSAQIQRLLANGATWTVLGESVAPNGAPMAFVAVDNVPRLDDEITREVFGIEIQSLVVRSLVAFVGEMKVTDYTFQKFRWNPKVGPETFKM